MLVAFAYWHAYVSESGLRIRICLTVRERVQSLSQLTPLITKALSAQKWFCRRYVWLFQWWESRAVGVKVLVPRKLPHIVPHDRPSYGQLQGEFVGGMSNQESTSVHALCVLMILTARAGIPRSTPWHCYFANHICKLCLQAVLQAIQSFRARLSAIVRRPSCRIKKEAARGLLWLIFVYLVQC